MRNFSIDQDKFFAGWFKTLWGNKFVGAQSSASECGIRESTARWNQGLAPGVGLADFACTLASTS